jgi:TetR/AcrR family transcriptional repressor of nem operon
MRAQGQSIREKIVTTADDLFYKRGYINTSFADIADAVGISRGNFYYHFKTKDDILAAVIEYRKSLINDMLQRWNQETDSPVERLCCYVDMMVGLKDEISQHGCPVGSVCSELIKLRNINQSNATEMITLFRVWMVQQFMALGYDKQQADQFAMHLLSGTQGVSLMANAFADKDFLLREMGLLKDWIASLKAG